MNTKLKYTLGGLVVLLLLSFNLEGAAKQPNIVFIMTDQQHDRMMSCAGNRWVKTPHLDGLVADGIRFEVAYSANCLCSPTRGRWSSAT